MVDFNFTNERTQLPEATDVNFNFGPEIVIIARRILAGQSNNITAIWASPTASRSSGKMYITSTGSGAALSVIDLGAVSLYDRYTSTIKGRANETLDQDDPIDIVV